MRLDDIKTKKGWKRYPCVYSREPKTRLSCLAVCACGAAKKQKPITVTSVALPGRSRPRPDVGFWLCCWRSWLALTGPRRLRGSIAPYWPLNCESWERDIENQFWRFLSCILHYTERPAIFSPILCARLCHYSNSVCIILTDWLTDWDKISVGRSTIIFNNSWQLNSTPRNVQHLIEWPI